MIDLGVRPLNVADLARRQAASVSWQAFPFLPAWHLTPDAPFVGLIARHCIEATDKLTSMQVWFRGAIAAVKDVPVISFIDEDETLVAAMDVLEGKLLSLRAEILNEASSIKKIDGPRMWSTHDALGGYAQANADLFESVQAFKWGVIEHDYRANMVAGLIADSIAVFESLVARLKK